MRLVPRKLEMLGIDVMHGCQLRCVGCPNSSLRPRIRHMPVDVFRACMGNVDVSAIKNVRLFNFGEPLLHPDLPGIVDWLGRQRFRIRTVEISTNAQTRCFPMLAEVFKTGRLDRLTVSCDGDGSPEEYERLRPPAKWGRLIEFLAKSKEYRDAHSPNTQLVTTTVCESEEGRRRWRRVLGRYGYTPRFRRWINLPGSKESPSGRDSVVPQGICVYLQQRTLYVDWDGTVVACCGHPRAGVFGDLKREKYSEILRSRRRSAFVERLRTRREAMPICGACEIGRRPSRLERVFSRSWLPWNRPSRPVADVPEDEGRPTPNQPGAREAA